MDNFSKYILSWKASLELKAGIFLENLKEAYRKHFPLFIGHDNPTELIVDGGSENNNLEVEQYLDGINRAIKKLVAQKDIIFSNSLIEVANKRLKYRQNSGGV